MSAGHKKRRGKTLGTIPELSEATRRKRTWWRKLLNSLLAPTLHVLGLLWFRTCRFVVMHEDGSEVELDPEQNYVFATWHEQIFGALRFFARELDRNRRIVTLISPSVDGDLISQVAQRHGCDIIRGSATRSGASAMRTLLSVTRKERATPFIVTDGPKGPSRVSKPGVAHLSGMAGVPVLPIACVSSADWRLGTWDQSRLARPFSKMVVVVGQPRTFARGLDEEGSQAARAVLDRDLERITELAETRARA